MNSNSEVTAQPAETVPIARVEEKATLSNQGVDFVLVTALAEERDAVLDKLPGYRKLPPFKDDIRIYFQAQLPVTFPDGKTGTYRVIVMPLLGMGRVQAATAITNAIARWHPRYIVLVGIAGGVAARGVSIGDILIADQVVDYELQKLTPQGPQVRWEVHRAEPRLLNACHNFMGESWQELARLKRPARSKPKRHTGPIASGDKVIAFGDVLKRYREVWPKLIGVEMEAAGVATAAFQSSEAPGFFMVRCVSDLADEHKGSADVEKWRSYACDAAASFAIALLKSGPVHLLDVNTKEYAYLTLIKDGQVVEVFALRDDEILIGRNYKVCQVAIPLEYTVVGKIHAQLTHTGKEIFVKSLHDHGTYINGKLVPKHERVPLKPNQLLTLGGAYPSKVCALELSLEKPPAPSIPSTDGAKNGPELVRILFLAANPFDTTRLRIDEEFRAIDLALYQTEFRDKFDLRQCSAVRIIDLQTCLLRHKPTIVHFSGHGSASSEIILEDNFGNSKPIPTRALSSLFSILKDSVHCVVLNACYTEQQARAIAEHVDCVIGMSETIEDTAAISFATAFYRALGFGSDVEAAFELGRNEIDLSELGDQDKLKLLAIKRDPKTLTFVRR